MGGLLKWVLPAFGKMFFSLEGDGSGAGSGSGDAGGAGAGGGEGGAGSGAGAGAGAGAGSPDWKATLPPDTQKMVAIKGWKTPEDAIKGYSELEKLVGQDKIPAPRKDVNGKYEKGELERYLQAVGMPKEAKEYKIPETLKLEADAGITVQQLEAFKPIAHKYGLLPSQFEGVMSEFAGLLNAGAKADLEAKNKKYDETVAGLKQELGEAYDGKIALASRVIKGFVDAKRADEIVKKFGNDPDLIKLLANIGDNMSEEKLSGEGMSGGILTPDQAEAEMRSIRGDSKHPYFVANHPDHKYWVDRFDQLTKLSMAGRK